MVNIKIENKTINLTFPDAQVLKLIKQTEITPEIEQIVKEDARKRLENVSESLDLVSDSTASEVVTAASTTALVDVIKKL